jgi:hypothetical protein
LTGDEPPFMTGSKWPDPARRGFARIWSFNMPIAEWSSFEIASDPDLPE